MKSTLAMLLFIVSFSAMAACEKMAKDIVTETTKIQKVTSQGYKDFYLILKHYRSEGIPTFKPFIRSIKSYLKRDKILGYEVIIEDGGDESTVRYVLNADKMPVVAYWSNQTPITYWFCGNKEMVDSEETVEGTEI